MELWRGALLLVLVADNEASSRKFFVQLHPRRPSDLSGAGTCAGYCLISQMLLWRNDVGVAGRSGWEAGNHSEHLYRGMREQR